MTTVNQQSPAGRTRPPRRGSGSRARSREIGYAEAMHDVWQVLRARQRQYQALAADTAHPALAAAFTGAAAALDAVAAYALDASAIHGDQRGGGIEGYLRFLWQQPSTVLPETAGRARPRS